MNPLKVPIRFWYRDWKHERWIKRTNKERHKKGWHLAMLPPSKMVGRTVIFEVRDQLGKTIEVEIT